MKGQQFYRQKIIGNYIVDFYCAAARLVIEIDGSQHYSEEGRRKDEVRDAYFHRVGLRVMRFSSVDVMQNVEGIVEQIYDQLEKDKSP